MKKKLKRICPVCTSELGEILYTQNFIVPNDFPLAIDNSGTITQYVVTCGSCGFVFTDVELSQQDYDKYYAKYGKYSCARPQNSGLETFDIDDYLISIIESIIKSDKSKKIIDIGCGSGKLLIDLKSKGFTELFGIDTSLAIASLLENSGIKCETTSITEKNINLIDSTLFDIVCLISVLEHVYDLDTALSNISAMLKDNAYFIVLLPDVTYYHKELTNPIQQINLEHINHFDKISLDNLLKQYGFLPHTFDKFVMNSEKTSSTQLVCVYRKCEISPDGGKMNIAIDGAKSVGLLIEKWKKVKDDKEIERMVASREEVVVYGTGNYTYSMLSDTILKNCNIVAFVDGNPNKQRTLLMGLPIYGPNFLANFTGTIVISVAYDPQTIIQKITGMGLKNKTHVI